MRNFPLKQFLTSLAADGILLAVRDYERLLLVFQSGSPWSVARLKHVVCALLAKSEDQQRLIERKFERFFKADDSDLPEFDIRQVLQELRDMPHAPPPRPKSPKIAKAPDMPVTASSGKIPSSRNTLTRPKKIVLLLLGVLLCAGVLVWKLIPSSPPSGPQLGLRPKYLDFGERLPGSETERTLSISNVGGQPLTIENISLIGAAPDDYRMSVPTLPMILQPGDERELRPRFIPMEKSCLDELPEHAEVEIIHNGATQSDTAALQGMGVMEITDISQTRSYSNVPTVKGVQYAPLESSRLWLLPGGLFLALLCVAESYRRYLRRLERGPQDRPPDIDPRAPKMFRSAAIGGSPSPWLDDETLCELADSIGYFKSRQAGKRLDVAASVKTTLKHGGIPICEFFRRSRVRSLLILEDANAEALEWNRIAKELAAGLKRYGVPVIYGRFRGAPDTFDSDGHLRYLEDLEDRRNGMLLLLFTDGKSFYRPHNRFALEALAHWPMVAWVDLRDARFRDESVLPAYENKIPIYPATREGLLQAVKSFLSESGKILQIPPGPPLGKGGIGNDVLSKGGAGGISSGVDIERLLDEALP